MITLAPPTRAGYVSSAWGAPRRYRDGWHEGLDFPGQVGEPVLAAADGVVARVVNRVTGHAGRWVAIEHGEGVTTRYLHNERNEVQQGQRVRKGQVIGRLGATGTKSSAPHVHFDTKIGEPTLSAYIRRFGMPRTGFGRMSGGKRGVPSEPLMSGARYGTRALEHIARSGVVTHNVLAGTDWVPWALAAGAVFLAWEVL